MAPSTLKGLSIFVADIRNCPSKQAEQARVAKELNKIRLKFTTSKNLSAYDRKKYVWKLVYCHMLGYAVDIGEMQIINLMSSSKYSEKACGYLSLSLVVGASSGDVIRLTLNLIKMEIMSNNEPNVALALNTIANIGTREMSENLLADVCKLVNPAAGVKAYIRRKAYLCILKLFQVDVQTQLLTPNVWATRLSQALENERDIGCLMSLASLVIGLLEVTIVGWQPLYRPALNQLNRILGGDVPPTYVYYGVLAPWLQVKLLRLLQFFPPNCDPSSLPDLNSIIEKTLAQHTQQQSQQVATKGSSKKKNKAMQERKNKANIEHSILFECLNLMIHLEQYASSASKQQAAAWLQQILFVKEADIRCLGLEVMSRLAWDSMLLQALKKLAPQILVELTEADISIRRQALNLLFSVCGKDNWGYVVDELLDTLKGSDVLLQEDLVVKIAILVEQFAPDLSWYVDVVFKVIEYAPQAVPTDIWHRVVQVVTGFDNNSDKTELQTYAAQKAYDYLSDRYADETMVKLGAYLLGEFGQHISSEAPGLKQLNIVHRHFGRCSSATKALLLVCYAKFANAHPHILNQVLDILSECSTSQDVELQARSCELNLLLRNDEALVERALAMMPTFSDSIQTNNPLIRRMKGVAGKSRAHTRDHLETTAKTEGGLLRQSKLLIEERAKAEAALDAKRSDMEGNNANHTSGESSEKSSEKDSGTESSEESEETSSESSEASDESEDENGRITLKAALGARNSDDLKDLWRRLCVLNEGDLYVSPVLVVSVRQQYRRSEGVLAIKFTNPDKERDLVLVSATIEQTPTMLTQSTSPDNITIKPGQSVLQQIKVKVLQPYLNPPKYLVGIMAGNSGPSKLPFSLPIIMTKFMVPAPLSSEAFQKYWQNLGNAKEHQLIGLASVGVASIKVFVEEAFNMSFVQIGSALCGSGSFHTATPNPNDPAKMICVACMCRIDHASESNKARVTIRAALQAVATMICQIFAAYLLTAPT